jgi:hypothetical protein
LSRVSNDFFSSRVPVTAGLLTKPAKKSSPVAVKNWSGPATGRDELFAPIPTRCAG